MFVVIFISENQSADMKIVKSILKSISNAKFDNVGVSSFAIHTEKLECKHNENILRTIARKVDNRNKYPR